MSEFIDLYREKNRIKHKLRILRKKADPDEYWALKAKEKELNEKLNQIIADDFRLQNKFSVEGKTNFKEKILEGIKIHTIRADPSNRWRPGMSIQMCYRGKNYSILEEFNKGLPHLQKCKAVQEITIDTTKNPAIITVDGRQLGLAEHLLLAKNDGFEDIHEFYRWFKMIEFKGKIIHWGEYRY